MPVGMGLSFIAATLIGYGTFRLRGVFFSIATIAFAEILRVLILVFKSFSGGASGLYTTYAGNSFIRLTFRNDTPFYYIMLVVLSLVVFYTSRFEKSKIGYCLGAIKGDEDAAESLGIETFKIKLLAFQISAMITAVVGSIYASFLTYIDPTTICGMDLSVKIGVVAIMGGVGTLWGPVLGAFIIVPLIEITSILMGQQGGSQLLYGLALVLVVIFKPTGIISLFAGRKKKDKFPSMSVKMEVKV
jgi:branched-chain amino acid transport system permease protein